MTIYQKLLAKSCNVALVYGTLSKVANSDDVYLRTFSRIWRRASASGTYLSAVSAVKSRLNGRPGKPRANVDTISAALQSTPLRQRTTLQDAVAEIGTAKTTLWNVLRQKDINV